MKYIRFILFSVLVTLFLTSGVLAAETNVFGANRTIVSTSRLSPYAASNHSAYAGNITELTIWGSSITQSWQGYYGNVTGTITLSDLSSNVMYNWSLASPRGQIYSSTNGSGIGWQYIQCFNYTANGTFANDTARAGATSYAGLNLTQLQEMFGINSTGFTGSVNTSWDVDSIDHTFTYYGDGTGVDGPGHRAFFANYQNFSQGECWTSRIFGPGGTQTTAQFEEVLLYEPESRSVVFTALLNENLAGFDSGLHDFQMLVLEDGHGTNIGTTTYFFYVELE